DGSAAQRAPPPPRHVGAQVQLAHLVAQRLPLFVMPPLDHRLNLLPRLAIAHTPEQLGGEPHTAADAVELTQAHIEVRVGAGQEPAPLGVASPMGTDEQRLIEEPPRGLGQYGLPPTAVERAPPGPPPP